MHSRYLRGLLASASKISMAGMGRTAAAALGLAACAIGGAAHADALSSPSFTAPLSPNANPYSVDAGPLGKVFISGQVSGLGLVQSNHTPNPVPGAGNSESLLDISNGQVEIQTTSGPLQFFLEAGAYTFPSLGTPYIKPGKNLDTYFGALPVAYGKYVVTPEISIQAGSLPTLIGSEYAFTYQNMNIERGLLWNQEPVISKGVQVNYAKGPLSVSISVNDGYYSDHYNWISGLASYAINGENTIALNGGTHFSKAFTNKFRAPDTLNNSSIFDASYTWTHGPWLVNPYFQYTKVDSEPDIGYKGASTYSGAVLAKYTFSPVFSVAGRAEYISTTSQHCPAAPVDDDGGGEAVAAEAVDFCTPTSVLYGPGSNAFSLTLTPTYQKGIFFARGEVSYTRAGSTTPGFAFGEDGTEKDQVRGLIETGFLF